MLSDDDDASSSSIDSGIFDDDIPCPFKDFPDGFPWTVTIFQTGLLPLSSKFAGFCQHVDAATMPLTSSSEMNIFLCQEYSPYEEVCALHLAEQLDQSAMLVLVLVCLSSDITESLIKKIISSGYQTIVVRRVGYALFTSLVKAYDRFEYLTKTNNNTATMVLLHSKVRKAFHPAATFLFLSEIQILDRVCSPLPFGLKLRSIPWALPDTGTCSAFALRYTIKSSVSMPGR